ncbi:MAG: helix-turn-helix transcriptional regulator [Eubacteriales bacterium]
MIGMLIKQERLVQRMSQSTLCQNICTTSYLSKIENGNATCSNEIYEQLLEKLKIEYISDDSLCNQMELEFNDILSILRTQGYCYFEDLENPISPLCEKMRYSNQCMKALLLCTLVKFYRTDSEISQKEIDSFENMIPNFDEGERLLFFYMKTTFLRNKGDINGAIQMLRIIESAKEPWTYQGIGFYLCITASYQQAIEKYQLAYNSYAKIGAVKGMLDTALCLLVVYCNRIQLEEMLRWSAIIEQINLVVNNNEIKCSVPYNLGSTYLVCGEIQQAISYLSECEKLLVLEGTKYFENITYMKLAFSYAIIGEREQAKMMIDKTNVHNMTDYWLLTLDLIHYIIRTPNYLRMPDYSKLLEGCLEASKKEFAKSFSRFYVIYLFEAYKAQRQYKKATMLLEEYKFFLI